MLGFQHIDLLSVGITSVAIGILGFITFFDNRKSVTNRTFLAFSLITIFYGVFNYLNYQVTSPELVLWLLRLTIFFAVWHAFSFFQLFYIFPNEKFNFPPYYKYVIVPFVTLTAILTLSPLVFSTVSQVTVGEVANPVRGPAIAVFGLTVTALVVMGLYLLIQKKVHAKDILRLQLEFILLGAMMTFSLIIIFNFILPIFFDQLRFIPLAPVFIFPLVAATAYAIFKHGLLNARIIAADILTFFLIIATFSEVLLARSATEVIFRAVVLGILLIFGILLIRGVRREVTQREALQKLTEELKSANAELRRLDQAKSEFISIASHQFRAPLTVIRGYVSLMLDGTYGPIEETFKDPLRRVSYSTEQLVRLVNDLLNLSRMESGKIKFDFATQDFVALVSKIIEEIKPIIEKKGRLFSFKNELKDSTFSLDPYKLREALVNIIDNAIKYSSQQISVKLETSKTFLNGVRFSVHDDGIGLQLEDITKLFIKFGRSAAAQRMDPNGMGIGLYFAKMVIDAHQGKIWAESDGPGQGSTFIVELPMNAQNKQD